MSPPTYVLDSDEKTRPTEEQYPIVQQFEISDPIAKACWYKDGTQIYPKREPGTEEHSQILALVPQHLSDDGGFGCDASDGVPLREDVKGGVSAHLRLKNLVICVKLSPTSLFSLWLCPNSRAVSLA